MSRIGHLLGEFSEQNLLLQMLLGVLSETERVRRLLPRPARKKVARAASPPLDPFTAALLGLVSLRVQLGEIARRSGRAPRGVVPGEEVPPPTIRELLR